MDAFFASVELLRCPELRGQPVVVGGRRAKAVTGEGGFARLRSYAGRGVVTTCTYEARAFGVRSGLGLMKAAALAPDAILLPADFEAYSRCSRLFKAAVAEIAPVIEDRGIDEIYLDLTEVEGESHGLGMRLKQAVCEATDLTCSVGITPNKLLSKLASELQKPDGLTILTMEDLPTRIWPLKVGAINGIGPKASGKLESLGIRTIGELAAADPLFLIRQFGQSYGAWLARAAQGQDDSPVVTHREVKSVSTETTFERDLHPRTDREALTRILLDLCERVARDLARKGCQGKTIGIKLRFEDFQTLTRDVTLGVATADAQAIREAARSCLKRVTFDRKLRLLGVRVGSLVRPGEEDFDLVPPHCQVAETPLPFDGDEL
jgi:DNA polymerase-4